MRKAHKITFAALAAVLFICVTASSVVVCLRQFTFNESDALDKWSEMILKRQVDYTLLRKGGEGYVQALSENACSALYYKVGFKLKDYPILTWQWRVLKFPDLSKAKTELDRDDYAARIYVIFPLLNFSSSKFIEYVWSESKPVGTITDSPVGDNVRIIVIRSGKDNASEWSTETRNMYDDYRMVFGAESARHAGAIAIMCDADGTQSTAESAFDNIAIQKIE